MLTLTVMLSVSVVVVPEAGLRLSHDALSLAFQLNIPPPALVMLNVWAAGFAPPSAPVNVKLPGSEPLVGGGGVGSVLGGGGVGSVLGGGGVGSVLGGGTFFARPGGGAVPKFNNRSTN